MKTVIKAENISKQYRLGLVGTGTVRDDLKRWWYNVRGKENPFLKIGESNDRSTKGESDYVWSLRDINFEINQGDSVGIIGRNGAGKSTLLKILSQVTQPTTGKIYTKGRIASLLEVGTGFHPEMTGRENIYLNGAILGMRKHEITRKLDEIIAFSGVERYIDTPVKRYSSGMYVRLAFAVAAHLESEILIVDEVLAVGDAEFQKKCLGKMNDVSKGEGRTVLFVSHNMAAVKSLCNQGMLLENGKIADFDSTDYIVSKYLEKNNQEQIELNKEELSFLYKSDVLEINHVGLDSKNNFSINDVTIFKVNFESFEDLPKFNLSLVLYDVNDVAIFNTISQVTGIRKGKYEANLKIPQDFLNDSYYSIRLLFVNNSISFIDIPNLVSWSAIETKERKVNWYGKYTGVIRPNLEWDLNERI